MNAIALASDRQVPAHEGFLANSSELFPQRLFILDTMRGLAALSVIFWHWGHFFAVGDQFPGDLPAREPLYDYLWPLYGYGALGVDFFFALSGFVFFWLFASGLASRGLSLRVFAIDRFSRLYPLHIATFVLVWGLQLIYLSGHETYFVYQQNDLFHALLNVLLIPAWGLEKGWSFNAPIWSVSVEMMMYIIFAVICLSGRGRHLLAIILIVVGFWLPPELYKIATGLREFFLGGLGFVLLSWSLRALGTRMVACFWIALAAAGWVVALRLGINADGRNIALPLTVTAAAAAGVWRPGLCRHGKWLGDISYAVYLLHFPLQLIFATTVDFLGLDRSLFSSVAMLALFFAVLLPVSLGTHKAFELPAKKALRSRLAGRGRTVVLGRRRAEGRDPR